MSCKFLITGVEHLARGGDQVLSRYGDYYTYMEFKAHSSRIWPDRNRFVTNKPSVAHTLLPGTTVSSAEHKTVRPVHTR